ncbi:MAG: PAS domain-containing protein [Limisphaerales bacterium]
MQIPTRPTRGLGGGLVILAAGIGTVALGFATLLGWGLGRLGLANFGVDLMPMAPSTAVLFVCFGAAVCLRARTPLSHRAFWFSAAAGWLVALVALVLFVLGCLGIHWRVEHLGFNIQGTVDGVPVGHMSPVTAACFLLASLSFLSSFSPSAAESWRSRLAVGVACVLLGVSFVFLAAYFLGTPFLYGGPLIPMALNTILAFTMLSLSLLILAAPPPGLLSRSAGDDSRTAVAFVLIFVLLAGGIVTTGYLYHRSYERRYRAQVEGQLSAIAEMKAGELMHWREERLADADLLYKNVALSDLVRRFLENPADADAQRQLSEWMGTFCRHGQYDQVRLLDLRSVSRLAIPAARTPMSALVGQRLPQVLRSGQAFFQDFYRNERDQRVYLAVLVPVLDERDGSRPLGAVVLRIDPETYLYPLIKIWPSLSATAETLLVRREGNEAVFLNELRFQTNTALNLRAALDRVALPAAQTALGRMGVMEGRDYRGVPVLAALRKIPDSPWSLVARMDTAEVYAPIRERLGQVVVLMGALLLGAGACVGLVWRQQHHRFYQEQAAATETMRASEVRYRRLFESAKDGILILDAETGMVVDVNPFLMEMLGFSREAFLGKKIWELGFFKDILANQANFAELQEKEYVRYDDLALETADGRRIEVEFVSNVYLVNHQKVIQCNIRDITERKRMEDALRASEQEFRSLAEAMPQIVWATRPDGWNIYFNQRWVDYTGLTLEQSYGHGWNIPFHPDDKQRGWEAWQRATQNGGTYSLECRLRRADGAYRWWLIRGVPLRNASGEILKWFGTCTDIEDLKQAEVQNQAQLEELRRWQAVMLHREDRVLELKRQINELHLRLGEPTRFPSQVET